MKDYPNLTEFLKGAALADFIRHFKKPEGWSLWLIVLVGIALTAAGVFKSISPWIAFPIFMILILGVPYVLTSIRHGVWGAREHMLIALKTDLAKVVRRQFNRKLIPGKLTTDQMAAIEAMAGDVQSILKVGAAAQMFVGRQSSHVSDLLAATDLADEQIRNVLLMVVQASGLQRPLTDGEDRYIQASARALKELAAETERLSDLSSSALSDAQAEAFRECLANLRSISDSEEEVKRLLG